METMTTYSGPVARLLELGEPEYGRKWADYREYGLSEADIPELIRLATDMELINEDQDIPESWAPEHACRALGQFRAVEAITPLINLFQPLEEYAWLMEDMPTVFALIGPEALPALAAYLLYPYRTIFPRETAAGCIAEIGKTHHEARDSAAQLLMDQLTRYWENDPELNGILVSYLIDLKAKRAFGLIRAVYASGNIDEMIVSYETVEQELG